MRTVKFRSQPDVTWYVWSDNTNEDGTLSCLPYPHIDSDDEGHFVYDLKHFPCHDVTHIDGKPYRNDY